MHQFKRACEMITSEKSRSSLLATVANLLAQIPRSIPAEIVIFSWNSPKMISHGRKSHEKCYVEELATWTSSKIKLCFTFVDHSIDCHWLLSLAVRFIIAYIGSKSLRKIVEMARCHIKIKRNLMVTLLLILRDCGVAAKNTLFQNRPQLSSACTRNQLSNVPSEIFNLKSLHGQICNFREQVVRAGCKLLRTNCHVKIPTLRRKFAKLRGKQHPA